jgi:hypothetical protein
MSVSLRERGLSRGSQSWSSKSICGTHDVAPRRRSAVGADYDAPVELDGHDRGLSWVVGVDVMAGQMHRVPMEIVREGATYTEVDLASFEPVHVNWLPCLLSMSGVEEDVEGGAAQRYEDGESA